MSMAELMRAVARLPRAQQNALAAFLLHIRLQQDKGWQAEMTQRIDDQTPENWVKLEDLKPAGS